MKPLIDGMLLLSLLLLLIRIKQIFLMFSNRDMELVFFIPIITILAIMIWLVLIKSEKLQSMTIVKGELIYRNWHGKLDHCAIDEIKRIEENGAYIFFFKSEKEIFNQRCRAFLLSVRGITGGYIIKERRWDGYDEFIETW